MRNDGDTDIGGTGGAFLTTHWSMVKAAASGADTQSRELINLLLQRYWKPIYCYLRRQGVSNEDAKDLTQGFLHEIVLEQNLLKKADAAKGRFRSLLLIALNRYVDDVRDRKSAQKRQPRGSLVSLDEVEMPALPANLANAAPEDTFHYAWVSSLLEQVLESVKRQCCDEDKQIHWCVFRDRVLDPIMERTHPPPLKEIMGRYGITKESKASNMIVTVKRRFQATLRRFLRESVTSDDHVKDECDFVRHFFSKMAQDSA